MLKIIGVRFKSVGKIYYFDPKDYDVKMGDKVIVETARGVECGEVALVDREIDETRFTNPVKGIIRLATPNDMKTIEKNRQKEKDALKRSSQSNRESQKDRTFYHQSLQSTWSSLRGSQGMT